MQTTPKQTEPSNTQSSVKLYGIVAEDLGPMWDMVSDYLRNALAHSDGKYSLEDIKERLEDGRMQLLIAMADEIIAAAVTQVTEFPQKRVMTIILLGGERMPEWIHLFNDLERWAKDEGCAAIEIYGRPGWERVLKWEKIHTILRKNINESSH